MKQALGEAAAHARELFPGRYADKENYHCTLAFIGEVDKASLAPIQKALAEAAAGCAAFPVTLSGLSYFGRREGAILFCGLQASPALQKLAEAVQKNLRASGFPLDDAPFRAHITLARQAKLDPAALSQVRVAALAQQMDALTLFESARVEGKLKYLPLFTCPLGK
jgi:2'-5' RNA ligase